MKTKIIAIEGGEGTGKSTLMNILREKYPNSLFVREPGSSPRAEKIRDYILENPGLTEGQKSKAFAQARSALLEDVITPYIQKADEPIIFTDRSIISSMVYQTVGGRLSSEAVLKINKEVDSKINLPDGVILLDLDPAFTLERLQRNQRSMNYIDRKPLEYHQEIRQKFLDVVQEYYDKDSKLVLSDYETFEDNIDKIYNFIVNILEG